ncbi:MAG: TIGR04282 family arsenosugar biosynthesis glycosyltransferase [Sandaracinaceae bacterium]
MPAADPPVRVALFAKAPVPGRVKTRLGRDLGNDAAADLYAAFLADLVERLSAAPGLELVIWAAAETDVEPLEDFSVPVAVQPAGDLGVRMQAAMRASLRERARMIVLGSDAPTLPLSRLHAAVRALDLADLVVGPAVDGGYALIGATAEFDFGDRIRWSTAHALADTEARAAALQRRVARVRPLYDIDTVADLRLLRMELAMDPRRAPRTAAWLKRMRPF